MSKKLKIYQLKVADPLKEVILCDGNFFFLFWEIYFGELDEHTTANFSVHIYSYLEHTLKFLQSKIVSHC